MDAAMARIIYHTLLKPDASYDQIEQLSREAIECQFASVCVHPTMVQTAYDIVKGTNVKVCSVIGFPLGATLPEVKAFETKNVIANGATEVDMVINIGALKSREYETVKADIDAVVEAAKNKALVKVIVETALLNREELVKACEIAKEADAHFVKTSTGFAGAGAQTEDISIMKKVVGDKLKVKASGGIRDYDTAKAMVEAGADRIGTSSGTVICGAKLD